MDRVNNFLQKYRIPAIVIPLVVILLIGATLIFKLSSNPSLWIRESVIIQISGADLPTAKELIEVLKSQGATSVYFLNIIRDDNFACANFDVSGIIQSTIDANSGLRFITNMPSRMNPANPYYDNYTAAQLIDSHGTFNYSNPNLADNVLKVIARPWAAKNIKGYLIENAPSTNIDRYVKYIHDSLGIDGGSMANDVMKQQDYITEKFEPSAFRKFLQGLGNRWSFYQLNPDPTFNFPSFGEDQKRLVLIALYLFPGTPILNYVNDTAISHLLKGLSRFRREDAFKFGKTYFPNEQRNELAFTRVYKGSTSFAIALNFGAQNATVSFLNTDNIAESGYVVLDSTSNGSFFNTGMKINLNTVMLPPHGGKIIRF